MNLIQKLTKEGVISPPNFLPDNICLLFYGGSTAYGVPSNSSDLDVLGVCFPPRSYIFPHEAGFIRGFGTPPPNFEVYTQHHIQYNKIEYDLTIFAINRFVELARQGNPNLIDAIYTPQDCIIHITKSGLHLRENRQLFLSKEMVKKFKGFAFNHIKNMANKERKGKREDLIEKFGFDCKDGAHTIRTMLAAIQILETEDYDIRKDVALVSRVRAGEFSYKEVLDMFVDFEKRLDELTVLSKLRKKPNEAEIRQVLLDCLEIHYGKLHNVIKDDSRAKYMLNQISNILQENIGAY